MVAMTIDLETDIFIIINISLEKQWAVKASSYS